MAISRRLLEETELIQPGIWNEPMQRVICPTLVRLSGRDCCTCIVVHPHTALPCLCRERENASIRLVRLLPNRTGVPSSTALSLFLSRPLHPVNRSLLGGSPVLRSSSTTRERKLYSFHYIFYLDNPVQLESLRADARCHVPGRPLARTNFEQCEFIAIGRWTIGISLCFPEKKNENFNKILSVEDRK